MSERIDHAAEALGILKHISHEPMTSEGAQAYAQGAITQAALAIAEQLRIANLIAMSESGRTTVNGARAALSALYVGAAEDGTTHMQLRPDILAALRIGDDDE